ncbi:hypothetical protein ONZ45_g8223 [Pleurotus djamor]|nr:hypothetical protein ONZ45_g8223 [Pleurotus djamor]
MASSATTHFARVPELLSRVFCFSTTKDNGQYLLVCKLWSNEVFNIEWRVVNEPARLYRLLAPLRTPGEDEPTCFTRPLTPEDWIRSLYNEIAVTRNRVDFLPNLRTLSIPAVTIVVQLFAHASVTSLSVSPHWPCEEDGMYIDGDQLFSLIRYKMPHLQRLSIDFYDEPSVVDKIQTESALTFRELKRLSYLALPPAWVRDGITKAVSELPNLHTLDVEYIKSPEPYEGLDEPLFSTGLTASSFPALKKLSLWITYPRATACLSQAFRPTSLETLQLDAIHSATREEMRQLLAIIGNSCPRLTVLKLSSPAVPRITVPAGPQIDFEDLKPLRACRYLRELHLVHDRPFLLDESNILKLLEPLNCLSILHLNPAAPGLDAPESALPISCLSSIVSACPSLSSLGLYVNTSSSDLPKSDPVANFMCLKTFDVGRSTLAEKDLAPVAFYLGHILPQNCEIQFTGHSATLRARRRLRSSDHVQWERPPCPWLVAVSRSMALSATTHVVRVPELLSRIFFFSPTKANGRNLLVCKLWSNEVLNIEWKVITEAAHLFHLLAPLTTIPESSGLLCFTRPLTPEDWIRFDRYAWRVKSLDLCSTSRTFDISVYHEISATRNRLDFLPNVRTLLVPAMTIVVQLFAHANITSFTVRPACADIEDRFKIKGASLFSQIRYKMPNLHLLSIDLYARPSEMDKVQTEAVLTLRELWRLSYLALPPAWIRDDITKAASKLPNLDTLDICVQESENPYEGLKPATHEKYKHLIEAIGSSCARLTVLRLHAQGQEYLDSANYPEAPLLNFQDLEPLLSCKYLSELHLSHYQPFLLYDSDIVALLKSLTSISYLHLNPSPLFNSQASSLSISCLSSIAATCPSISSLGLYINTFANNVPRADPMATFKSLKTLDVGRSGLSEDACVPLAFYLGHTLPPNCQIISCQGPPPPAPAVPEAQEQVHPVTVQWNKVRKLAPWFRQAVHNGERRLLSGSSER